jgi:hypothetical protein
MSSTNDVPKWVTEPLQKILIAFKRLGGQGGNINDVRKAVGVKDARKASGYKDGNPHVKKLIEHDLMRRSAHDLYVLTEEGYAMANLLMAREVSPGFADRATAKSGDFEVWDPETKIWKRIGELEKKE